MRRRLKTTASLSTFAALLLLPAAARAQRPTQTIWLSPGNQYGLLYVVIDGQEVGRLAEAATVYPEREPKQKTATSRTAADAGSAPAVGTGSAHALVSFHLGSEREQIDTWGAQAKLHPATDAKTVSLVEKDPQRRVLRTYTFTRAYPRSYVPGNGPFKNDAPTRMDLLFDEFQDR